MLEAQGAEHATRAEIKSFLPTAPNARNQMERRAAVAAGNAFLLTATRERGPPDLLTTYAQCSTAGQPSSAPLRRSLHLHLVLAGQRCWCFPLACSSLAKRFDW